jgi:hypothetical protein
MAAPIPAPLQGFPLVSNLQNLAPGAAKCLGVLGLALTQYFDCNVAPMAIKIPNAAYGAIERRIIFSENDNGIIGNWTAGIDPRSTSDQSGLAPFGRFIDSTNINAASAATYALDEFDVVPLFGASMPMFWSILVWNRTNQAFSSLLSDFFASYTLLSYA